MTKIRCFRRKCKGSLRYGLWVYAGNKADFYHGDRDESQAVRYSLGDMEKFASGEDALVEVEEISPSQALEILDNWPEAQRHLREAIFRHIAENVPA